MALIPFSSQLIADVGISMGDEGKGRLVYEVIDELKQSTGKPNPVAVVLKVNGGANSGHTAGGLKLNLLPAGVIDNTVDALAIGAGVVADPRKFLWEAVPLEKAGYKVLSRLVIDERTLVSDVSHRLLDLAWEDYRTHVLGEEPRGSTGRGITPAYCDEVGQWQICYSDFRGGRDAFSRKLHFRINRALRAIQHICLVTPDRWDAFFDKLSTAEHRANQASIDAGIFPTDEFDFHRFKGKEPYTLNWELVVETYWQAGRKLLASIRDVRELVLGTLAEGRYVIGEFGQSYWLDKRHGFAPNVTASHTFTPEFYQSAGIPVQPVHTIGCCKAYDTKVGTHVFLTQMDDAHPLAKKLKQLEFGTSTGRQRMVGWFDACEKGDALRYGGYQDIAINKLDALSYDGAWSDGDLLVCTAYEDDAGKRIYGVPRDDAIRAKLKPVYTRLPGWREDISLVRKYEDLPYNARRYVAFLMKSILDVATRNGTSPAATPNLRYIGVGPGPAQIIKDVPPVAEVLKILA